MPSVVLTIVAWLIYLTPGPVDSDQNDLTHPCSDTNNVANLISLWDEPGVGRSIIKKLI